MPNKLCDMRIAENDEILNLVMDNIEQQLEINLDFQAEHELLQTLCDETLDLPIDTPKLVSCFPKILDGEVLLTRLENSLRSFAAQELITVEENFTDSDGKSYFAITSVDRPKLQQAVTNKIVNEKDDTLQENVKNTQRDEVQKAGSSTEPKKEVKDTKFCTKRSFLPPRNKRPKRFMTENEVPEYFILQINAQTEVLIYARVIIICILVFTLLLCILLFLSQQQGSHGMSNFACFPVLTLRSNMTPTTVTYTLQQPMNSQDPATLTVVLTYPEHPPVVQENPPSNSEQEDDSSPDQS